jgi:PBP1b-binding outer membrane lipoprotein LpoB
MKKLIAVLVLAGSLAACNNSADGTDNAKDSIDSTASEVKDRMDSTGAAGTAVADSAKDKIDSSAEAKKDQLDSTQKK